MRAWTIWVLAASLAAGAAGIAAAQSPADGVGEQLRGQGYVRFDASRTLLGRVQVIALGLDGSRREIVFNPATGEILRDYHEEADGTAAPRLFDWSDDDDRSRETRPSRAGDDRDREDDDRGSGDDDAPGSGGGGGSDDDDDDDRDDD